MPNEFPLLRQTHLDNTLLALAAGQCYAVYGLSNTGKSPFLRALAAPARRPAALLIYIDCNRVVELSATGFYEIVIRSLLETLETDGGEAAWLGPLREAHNRLTTASAFQASLAFNNALTAISRQVAQTVVLLFDEFDEIYATLENRALLNLRALKDHPRNRLAYVTATIRPLSELRAGAEDEFAELFATNTLALGLLDEADTTRLVAALGEGSLPRDLAARVAQLGGGHLGLTSALAQAAARHPDQLTTDPNLRAECLKIWNQLQTEEQTALMALVTEAESGLAPGVRARLQAFGLLRADHTVFSEVFTAFIRRQSAAPAVGTGVRVDEDAGEVWVDGTKVMALTDLEYKLMRLLHERQDRLTTKEMIVEAVWGGDYFDKVDDARIEKLISRLRAKVEPDPLHPRYVLTQRGRGYKLASQTADNSEPG